MIWDDSSLAMTRGRRQRGTRDSMAWMIHPEGEREEGIVAEGIDLHSSAEHKYLETQGRPGL